MHACGRGLGHKQLHCVDGGCCHNDHGNQRSNDACALKGDRDGEQSAAQHNDSSKGGALAPAICGGLADRCNASCMPGSVRTLAAFR